MESSTRHLQPAALPLQDGFRLGPFSVDPAGGIRPADPQQPRTIRFRWAGCTLRATMQGEVLKLCADLGRVPSSAVDGGVRRAEVLRMLGTLSGQWPGGWRMCLLPDYGIRLETDDRLDPPPTAAGLMASVTCFALALRPYLDLLAEAGIVAGSGIVKVWPG